jgi:bifunctional NMN adenylyltransferase/nudix hydrolase
MTLITQPGSDTKSSAERTDIGVLVGRFQVPELHAAHRELIAMVAGWHKKFLLVLGCAPVLSTRRNPLDFQARKLMINAYCAELPVVPLMDCADDIEWSRELDRRVREVFPVGTVTLYGGRDSFIPHYHGQFPCQEVEPSTYQSGTADRHLASLEVKGTADWRAGVVYAAYNRYPQALPTVDVAVLRTSVEGRREILLARKPGERGFRLIGGFVDPADPSLEAAARREVMEEAHIEVSPPRYLGSHRVDDWRYRQEVDQIITSLFVADFTFGAIQPDDDIEELRWFALDAELPWPMIEAVHHPLLRMTLEHAIARTSFTKEEHHELPAAHR